LFFSPANAECLKVEPINMVPSFIMIALEKPKPTLPCARWEEALCSATHVQLKLTMLCDAKKKKINSSQCMPYKAASSLINMNNARQHNVRAAPQAAQSTP
jgi:hypothetical protein